MSVLSYRALRWIRLMAAVVHLPLLFGGAFYPTTKSTFPANCCDHCDHDSSYSEDQWWVVQYRDTFDVQCERS